MIVQLTLAAHEEEQAQVGALLKVSIRTIWRMRSASQIPDPVRVVGGVRWRLLEIEDWIAKG